MYKRILEDKIKEKFFKESHLIVARIDRKNNSSLKIVDEFRTKSLTAIILLTETYFQSRFRISESLVGDAKEELNEVQKVENETNIKTLS